VDFTHTLSCERPFQFLHQLVRPSGIDNIIVMLDRNIHKAIFYLTRTQTRTWTRIRARIRTRTRTRKGQGQGHGLGHELGIGIGIHL
jgi:hypothetical protein